MRERKRGVRWCVTLWLGVGLFAGVAGQHAEARLDPLAEAEDKRNIHARILYQASISPKATRRQRAARVYGRMQHPLGLPPLLRLAADKQPQVREEAIFALGQLGWEPAWSKGKRKQILAVLKQALQDKHIGVRRAAIEAIGKYSVAGTEHLLTPLLQRPPSRLQAEALLALFRWKYRILRRQRSKKQHKTAQARQALRLSTGLLLNLKRLAHHRSARVRRNVAYYFARIRDPQGLALLLRLTKDPHFWTRFFALLGLAKIASPKGLPAALARLQEKSAILRTAAIQAISAMKGSHQLPHDKLLRDPSFHVRAALARAYSRDTRVLLYRLKTLATDGSPTVRAQALLAIARREKDKAFPFLQRAMQDPVWLLREAAVKASRFLKRRRLTLLQQAHKDRDVHVRAAAIEALGTLPGKQAFASIVKALDAKHLAERGAAVEALTKRKESQAFDAAWGCLQRSQDKRWTELRETLVGFIAKRRNPKSTLYLKLILRDPASSVANKARLELTKRGIRDLPIPSPTHLTFSPHRQLTLHKNPIVVLHTTRGKIVLRCFVRAAPQHVKNFVGLVHKGFYDGLLWHRVISNFVIQGGDPDGTGWGDAGYALRAEINRFRFHRGTLGMPRAQGWNTGGVQIFINHVPTPHLDGLYTVFGRVIRGLRILDQIERGDKILRATLQTSHPALPPRRKPPTRRAAKTRPTPRPTTTAPKKRPQQARTTPPTRTRPTPHPPQARPATTRPTPQARSPQRPKHPTLSRKAFHKWASGSLKDSGTRFRPNFEGGRPQGMYIASIQPGSMPARLGLRQGDVLLKINGRLVIAPGQAQRYYRKAAKHNKLTLTFRRGTKDHTASFFLHDPTPKAPTSKPKAPASKPHQNATTRPTLR